MDVTLRCPRCATAPANLVRDGHYYRADDSKSIQRYQCKDCGKKFSSATHNPAYRQKKRRINSTVRFCLASNMCQRDIAEIVGVDVKTVRSRLVWQAKLSRVKNKLYLQAYLDEYGPIDTVQFDDLVTFEHTKMKPITVPMAVVDGERIPLGFNVASIPAFGLLAAKSREKYGPRVDDSQAAREAVFQELSTVLPPDVRFKTDGHSHYKVLIKQYFPNATHEIFISDRGAVVGQGELKKTRFDELFSINHTFATVRAKINRLNRRTWCTTKDPERLADHIDVFIDVFCDRLKKLSSSVNGLRRQAFVKAIS